MRSHDPSELIPGCMQTQGPPPQPCVEDPASAGRTCRRYPRANNKGCTSAVFDGWGCRESSLSMLHGGGTPAKCTPPGAESRGLYRLELPEARCATSTWERARRCCPTTIHRAGGAPRGAEYECRWRGL